MMNGSVQNMGFRNRFFSRSYGAISGINNFTMDSDHATEEDVRQRLKWHYMNAYQKYETSKRKPWKLLIQIFKIVLVTIQVCWFSSIRFSVITYLDETHDVFRHLFLRNPNLTSNALYTKQSLYDQINYTTSQHANLYQMTLGAYSYAELNSSVEICVHEYNGSIIDPARKYFYFPSSEAIRTCHKIRNIENGTMEDFVRENKLPCCFHSVVHIDLRMSLRAIKISGMALGYSPQCIQYAVRLYFKNEQRTGKFKAGLHTDQTYLDCMPSNDSITGYAGNNMHTGQIVYDLFVILMCAWSLVLTTRSFVRNVKLAMFTFKYFDEKKGVKLSIMSDGAELVNVWFLIILLTDILTIVGSVFKIYIDTSNLKESYFYDVCSLCLGISVLFIWIGILRYLGFSKKYNIMLITLEASLPSVLRFLVCAGILYIAFTFCGYIVLGPYHPKFSTLSEVSECLFSLINGDDMFMTFREMSTDSRELWIFSKVYLYLFISLFIYVVLSLFIGIISDTYERIQSGEHVMCSNVRQFIHGSDCPCFTRAANCEEDAP